MIKIRGVVTKRTNVFPQLKESYYKCLHCGDIKGPVFHNNDDEKQFLGQCVICQSKGPYQLEENTSIYRNY
jgi:DNA replication licensing factor MCM2